MPTSDDTFNAHIHQFHRDLQAIASVYQEAALSIARERLARDLPHTQQPSRSGWVREIREPFQADHQFRAGRPVIEIRPNEVRVVDVPGQIPPHEERSETDD